jgi:hypothetical protein
MTSCSKKRKSKIVLFMDESQCSDNLPEEPLGNIASEDQSISISIPGIYDQFYFIPRTLKFTFSIAPMQTLDRIAYG